MACVLIEEYFFYVLAPGCECFMIPFFNEGEAELCCFRGGVGWIDLVVLYVYGDIY